MRTSRSTTGIEQCIIDRLDLITDTTMDLCQPGLVATSLFAEGRITPAGFPASR